MKENKSKSSPYQNFRFGIAIIIISIMIISGLTKLCSDRNPRHFKNENQSKYKKRIFNKSDSSKVDSLNAYINEKRKL